MELAIDWTLTETPYLGQNGHMPSPELLYQLYRDEFDGAYEEGTMFVLTLHPYLSGHRAPMQHLNQFVAYMKSKPGRLVRHRRADRPLREGSPLEAPVRCASNDGTSSAAIGAVHGICARSCARTPSQASDNVTSRSRTSARGRSLCWMWASVSRRSM